MCILGGWLQAAYSLPNPLAPCRGASLSTAVPLCANIFSQRGLTGGSLAYALIQPALRLFVWRSALQESYFPCPFLWTVNPPAQCLAWPTYKGNCSLLCKLRHAWLKASSKLAFFIQIFLQVLRKAIALLLSVPVQTRSRHTVIWIFSP